MSRRTKAKARLGLGGSYMAKLFETPRRLTVWRNKVAWSGAYWQIADYGTFQVGNGDDSQWHFSPFFYVHNGAIITQTRPITVPSVNPEGGSASRLSHVFQQGWSSSSNINFEPGLGPLTVEYVGVLKNPPTSTGFTPYFWIAGSDKYGLRLQEMSPGQWEVSARYNGTGQGASGGIFGPLPFDTPLYIVYSRAGSTIAGGVDDIRLYVNGVLVASGAPVKANMAFGQQEFGSTPFGGGAWMSQDLTSIAIHSTILTPQMIQDRWKALQWTDKSGDVRADVSVDIEVGMRTDDPLTRTAATGTCSLAFNNASDNSAKTVGYYSPGHPDCLLGFEEGAFIQVDIEQDGVPLQQFHGTIRTISTTPGFEPLLTQIHATDFFDVMSQSRLTTVPVQVNRTSDQVMMELLSRMDQQPPGVIIYDGSDVYPLALDNSQTEYIDVLAETVRLQHSELGYAFPNRFGSFVFENRHTRVINSSEPRAVLDGLSTELDLVERGVIAPNRVEVQLHPRKRDPNNETVLWSLAPDATKVRVNRDQTKDFNCPYRNPNTPQRVARVGGMNLQNPVAGTDFGFNTNSLGGGLDLSAFLMVLPEFGANSAKLSVRNVHPLYDAYIVDAGGNNKLQIRGQGIYDFQTIIKVAESLPLIKQQGLLARQLDMWYVQDEALAQAAGELLLNTYQLATQVKPRTRTVTYIVNKPEIPEDILEWEISDRIHIKESTSGLNSEYYINGRRISLQKDGFCTVMFFLTPADPQTYWILGQVGASELGVTTRLGYL